MAQCEFLGCENREALPFKCRYCQKSFCRVHRLPENHNCTKIHLGTSPLASTRTTIIEDAEFTIEQGEFEEPNHEDRKTQKAIRKAERERRKEERKYKKQSQVRRSESSNHYFTTDDSSNVFRARIPEGQFRDRVFLSLLGDHFTTKYEFLDFFIGLAVVALAWAIPSMLISRFSFWYYTSIMIAMVLITYSILIIPQKLMAKRFNCESRYVLSKIGLILTVITAISPLRFLSPGMLIVPEINYLSKKQQGLISFIGPLINLALGIAYLFLGSFLYTPNNPEIPRLMLNGSFLVSQFVFFGLLPIGLSRGKKIYNWNKIIYFSMLLVTIGLFASSLGLQVIPF